MPGLCHYDYGDAIRFGANPEAEDERDLSKVWMEESYFEAYTKGYLEEAGASLTEKEIELLPMGAKLMTLECGRIGFDAGGSDRKVSAIIDGKSVYSEETVWFPKQHTDPDYHYAGIVEAFQTAASKMPRVDAIGVSSAGIYMDNKTKAALLFIKVADSDFESKVKHILLMGRVTSGEGGNLIIETAKNVLSDKYPDIYKKVNLQLPDEKSRRVGQSIAAASLPQI